MKIEYQKSQNEDGTMWIICKDHSFDDEPKKEDNPDIVDMSIMRTHYPKMSGGPIIALFYYESDADEYIKFKNEQLAK